MTFLDEFEVELLARIESDADDTDTVIPWVSKKMRESYWKGFVAGQKNEKEASEALRNIAGL